MNQRTAIEMQYLKLLGVTLVFSTACIGASSGLDRSPFANKEVREIILDQIQHMGSEHLSEVIEWDIALEGKISSTNDSPVLANWNALQDLYVEVIPVEKNHKSFEVLSDQPIVRHEDNTLVQISYYNSSIENKLFVLSNHPSRAGPLS